MREPNSFRAGDSVTWTTSLPEYPSADGWSLHYRLLWPTGTGVDIDTTAGGVDGTDYTVELGAADTASWVPGAASLVSYVKKGSGPTEQRRTLEQVAVTILQDLTTATTFDGRSKYQKGLEDAEAAMAAYVAAGQAHVLEYEVAGRKMKFRDVEQIEQLINYYKREVNRERAALAILAGGSPGRVVYRG